MKRYLSSFVLIIGLALSTVAWAEPAADEVNLERLTQDGYTLTYNKSDEALARQLLPELVKRANNRGPSQLEQVRSKRKEFLDCIASELGLKKHTKPMGKYFDQFMNAMLPLQQQLAECKTFDLCRDVEAQTGDISLFVQYDSKKGSFSWITRSAKGSKVIDAINKLDILTINVPKVGTISDFDKACESLDGLLNFAWCGILGHEVAEGTLMSDIGVDGPFVRWFTEGVATYAAGRATECVLGKDAAVEFLADMKSRVSPDMVERTDLLNWRANVWCADMPFEDPKVTSASYWYSAHEIEELVKRHGDDTVKKICQEISKSKNRGSYQTLLTAIQKVTGEDITVALGKYGSKSKDEFKGIAIKNFSCKSVTIKGSKPRLGEESTTISRSGGDTQGLIVSFAYATKDRHAGFTYGIKKTPNSTWTFDDPMVQSVNDNMSGVLIPIIADDISIFQPGEYPLEIKVNGKVIKEIKIKVVS